MLSRHSFVCIEPSSDPQLQPHIEKLNMYAQKINAVFIKNH